MDIPTSVAGLLVIVLGVLPGVPGDHIYRALAGVSWREKDRTHVLRLLAFSVLGLLVYALAAASFHWPPPSHVVPSTFAAPGFAGAQISNLGFAYLGHFAGAAVVALAAVLSNSLLNRIRTVSASRDAWDHFIRCAAPAHWIVVTLTSGEAYAGVLDHADVSTEPEYRDLLLAEPYRFDPTDRSYKVTYQQFLFIRGADVASIAAVYDPENDKRIVPADETPFLEAIREPKQAVTGTASEAESIP